MKGWQISSCHIEYLLDSIEDNEEIDFEYVNWRGIKGVRKILPLKIWRGTTEFHKERQWLLLGFDIHKEELRDFAISDIGYIFIR